MPELNPQQFKIDMGRTLNEEHDHEVEWHDAMEQSDSIMRAKKMPGVGTPEQGYYHQPSSRVRQMALPGMEMSVEDHLDALSKRTGKKAEIWTGNDQHQLSLKDPKKPMGGSYLIWDSRRGTKPTTKKREWGNTEPGEIEMIKSDKRGDGSAMFSTAEALAHEHGYAFPKHSESRMPDGVQFSHAMMKRRNERVW